MDRIMNRLPATTELSILRRMRLSRVVQGNENHPRYARRRVNIDALRLNRAHRGESGNIDRYHFTHRLDAQPRLKMGRCAGYWLGLRGFRKKSMSVLIGDLRRLRVARTNDQNAT